MKTATITTAFAVLFLMFTSAPGADEFTPGDGKIRESRILERIQKELSEDLARRKIPTEGNERKSTPDKRDTRKQVVFRVSIKVSNTSGPPQSFRGSLKLTQKTINVLDERTPDVRASIPIGDIHSIEFKNWKVLLKVLGNRNRTRTYFFPTACVVVDRSKRSYEGRCKVHDWLRMDLLSEKSKRSIKIYYTIEKQDEKNPKTNEVRRDPLTPKSISVYFKSSIESPRTKSGRGLSSR